MTVTLDQLLTATTENDVLALLIAEAQSRGLATTDWEEGSPELTLTEMFAGVLNDLVSSLMPTIIGGGFIYTATGAWLRLNAWNRFNLAYTEPGTLIGSVTLTCAAGSGPYTITARQLRFAYVTNPALIFTNTTGGVLAAGPSTLAVTVQAEASGAAYNAVSAGTLTTMLTPLGGVTANNPAAAFTTPVLDAGGTSQGTVTPSVSVTAQTWRVKITTSGQLGTAFFSLGQGTAAYGAPQAIPGGGVVAAVDGSDLTLTFANHATVSPSFVLNDVWQFTSPGTWVTTAGNDIETDASLQARCLARWPALGDVPTEDVYESWAKEASASVYFARATASPSTAATVTLIVAGKGITIPAATVTAIQTYVDARKPLTDLVTVTACGEDVMAIAGATITVSLALSTVAAAQAAAQANIQAYIDEQIGIGDGSTVKVRWAQLLEEIMSVTGVIDCTGLTLDGGTANVTVVANQIPKWTGAIATDVTWSAVS